MKKLSREQIKQGFESIPIETLLLGSVASKQTKLTHKQKEFAREIAMGETKAGAYRKAYKSKAKPKVASQEGQKLMKNPAISMQAEAISLALESAKYTTPAHLRALAIHRITEKAIDPDCPPAQQLKALELLGKMTEVALFTERREVIQSVSSNDMKEKLMESIRMAIANSQAIDIEAHQADDLLAELVGSKDDSELVAYSESNNNNVVPSSHWDEELEEELGGMASSNGNFSTPLSPDPQNLALPDEPNLHSIPHIESSVKSTLKHVNQENPAKSNSYESSSKNPQGTPPVNVSNTKG